MGKIKVTLDTNILISAVGFGGIPKNILKLVLEDKIKAVTTNILLAELEDVITKKFPDIPFELLNKRIRKRFQLVKPEEHLKVARDENDDRVLEAAIEGNCQYIVTGDKDLLDLKSFRGIKILKPEEFLKELDTLTPRAF